MLQMLNQNQMPKQTMAMNNPLAMLGEFNKFRQQMQGEDPKAMVEQLLQSGQMSPEQFEQLKQQAQLMQSFLK